MRWGDVLLTSDHETVAALETGIAQRIGGERYERWFQNRTNFSWEEDLLEVGVANHICLDLLQTRFLREISQAARDVFGRTLKVHFKIDPSLFSEAGSADIGNEKEIKSPELPVPSYQYLPAEETAKVSANTAKAVSKSGHKRRWHTLEEFVVGPCNRVAHASALAVVDNPGMEVNPLVLHGPVSSGKTHLLEAVYVGLRRQHRDWRVCFVTAEDFTNRFLQAMHAGRTLAFRKYYRDCDVLLVDDLHFLSRKKATREEFLHTYDVLLNDGKQIVMTCDCHPRLHEDFPPELVDRMVSGGVWGLMPPDFDTRVKLLHSLVKKKGSQLLDEQVLLFLADNLRGNFRELQGAINSIFHLSKIQEREVDIALVKEVLAELLQHNLRRIQLTDVDRLLCGMLSLSPGSFQNRSRSWLFSFPRMIAMFLSRKHTQATYSEVGSYFGNRTHSTVVSAEKKVKAWLREDAVLRYGTQEIRVRDFLEQAERNLAG